MPPPVSQTPGKPYKVSKGGAQLDSDLYTLLPIDLRSSTPSDILNRELLPLLDPKLPTMFLAECVFCYMQPEESETVIKWFGDTFQDCLGVVYEMCGLE